MNDIIETLIIDGYAVEIYHDPDVEHPRAWCSSTLYTTHRRYDFGGESLSCDAASIEEAFAEHLADKGLTERDVIWLPVYGFEHSGLALGCTPFRDRWDSGQLGYIYMSRADTSREYGGQTHHPLDEGRGVSPSRGRDRHLGRLSQWRGLLLRHSCLDDLSIGGFYGSDHEASGLLSAARAEIRHAIRQKRRAHYTRLKRLIRAGVPLQYRPQFAL